MDEKIGWKEHSQDHWQDHWNQQTCIKIWEKSFIYKYLVSTIILWLTWMSYPIYVFQELHWLSTIKIPPTYVSQLSSSMSKGELGFVQVIQWFMASSINRTGDQSLSSSSCKVVTSRYYQVFTNSPILELLRYSQVNDNVISYFNTISL